ncbi:MAG: sulfatase, partial [Candidatus Binatia bacterium]
MPRYQGQAGKVLVQNILLLTIDTLRADRLGVYGYPKNLTPTMDLLAKEGTLFERTIAQSPWTRPSYGSLLTSLYPSQHEAFVVYDPARGGYHADWGDMLYDGGLRDDAETMAEIFRDRGYTTIALQTNWHVSAAHNFDQGFDYFLYEPLFTISLFDRSFLGPYAKYFRALNGAKPKPPFWMTAPPASSGDDAFKALIAEGLPQPLFMWINFMDTHSPYIIREKGVPLEQARITASYDIWDSHIPNSLLSEAYDGEVRHVDHYVGKIYNRLKDAGISDDTLIVLLSDHGEEFGDHQAEIHCCDTVVRGRHHGHSLYDELLHVPLIIRYPSRVPRGSRVKETVRLIDVLPTLLELAGISLGSSRATFEGTSLLPLIMNGNDPWGPRFSYSERTYYGLEHKAVEDGRYKMILQPGNGGAELYD